MSRRRVNPTIAAVVTVCTCLWTPPAVAASPPSAGETSPAPAEGEPGAGDEAGSTLDDAAPAPTAPSGDPEPRTEDEAPADEPRPAEPAVTQVESADAPEAGGVAGSVVSADDPAAQQAQADLEGEALDRTARGVPDRMPPLQTAAWWTMFGTVALGTAGGIFSGLSERQEDEAERLALGFDLETGKRYQYAERAAEYEAILDKGNTYQWVSRGFLIGAAVALTTSVTLFAVHAKRSRKESGVALRSISPFGAEVAF